MQDDNPMTAAPWSDHELEPGDDAPLAVMSAAYHGMMRKLMAERDAALEHNDELCRDYERVFGEACDWRLGHAVVLDQLETTRKELQEARADARRLRVAYMALFGKRHRWQQEARAERADARRLALNVARAVSHLPPLSVAAFAAWEAERGGSAV